MSLGCDFRLAAKSASYAFPEAKFGVLPATNGVSRLVRIIGPHWARYMIMANIPLELPHEALNAGLVHKVFPDESFEDDVMGFCRHLAKQDGELVGAAKVAIELANDLPASQAALGRTPGQQLDHDHAKLSRPDHGAPRRYRQRQRILTMTRRKTTPRIPDIPRR